MNKSTKVMVAVALLFTLVLTATISWDAAVLVLNSRFTKAEGVSVVSLIDRVAEKLSILESNDYEQTRTFVENELKIQENQAVIIENEIKILKALGQ